MPVINGALSSQYRSKGDQKDSVSLWWDSKGAGEDGSLGDTHKNFIWLGAVDPFWPLTQVRKIWWIWFHQYWKSIKKYVPPICKISKLFDCMWTVSTFCKHRICKKDQHVTPNILKAISLLFYGDLGLRFCQFVGPLFLLKTYLYTLTMWVCPPPRRVWRRQYVTINHGLLWWGYTHWQGYRRASTVLILPQATAQENVMIKLFHLINIL